jgi:hypothetical protein
MNTGKGFRDRGIVGTGSGDKRMGGGGGGVREQGQRMKGPRSGHF